MIRDCFIDRKFGPTRHTANEAGFNLPEHLMRSPAVAREIEPFDSAFSFAHKVIWQRLIVLDPMTKHIRTTEEDDLIRSSLNCSRDFSKTAAIESVGDVVDQLTAERFFKCNRRIWHWLRT